MSRKSTGVNPGARWGGAAANVWTNRRVGIGDTVEKALIVNRVVFNAAQSHDDLDGAPPLGGISEATLRAFARPRIAAPSEDAIAAIGPGEIDPFEGVGEEEKGRVFLDEDKAQKAHHRVAEQYGATEADGNRYWRLKAGIYKRMGGAFGRPSGGHAPDFEDGAKALAWVDMPEATPARPRIFTADFRRHTRTAQWRRQA